jgi:hypothetical protein
MDLYDVRDSWKGTTTKLIISLANIVEEPMTSLGYKPFFFGPVH